MINVPSEIFSVRGIINLVNQLKNDLQGNTVCEKFKPFYNLIVADYAQEMRLFLIKLRKYLISLSLNNPPKNDRNML